MSQHPYPDHVVLAVARALLISDQYNPAFSSDDLGTLRREFIAHAHTALQALWDASRVDTYDQLDVMNRPDEVIITGPHDRAITALAILESGPEDDYFPAHVIYWGDPDGPQ